MAKKPRFEGKRNPVVGRVRIERVGLEDSVRIVREDAVGGDVVTSGVVPIQGYCQVMQLYCALFHCIAPCMCNYLSRVINGYFRFSENTGT